jgi:phage host-nuclease inhibitor protein Gam
MHDFEKLGAFYLGKRYDMDAEKLTEELVLYDSKDLTTHAVIIGMTGSGKTGLGIGILEEAALDHIPVIAIDPKGDMGNLLLTFPKLEAKDFRPWINPRTAADKGQTADQFAAAQAALWKKGLGQWGQNGNRIAQLRKNVDLSIYTPGSNSGVPVSVLQSFSAPDDALIDDVDLYRERVQSTATGILTLLDIDADPVASREHILISRLLDKAWREGRDLDVPSLIGEIQNPPITRVGVMNLDSFFPAKDRFALAMRLNNLLAAPGFEAWMQGEPLDAKSLLYTEDGKPRISVMSIAHLDDAQRMFFVSMLLNELIAWMRAQQGTSSLRAILYMDEIFGYMPPVANPPSKKLFLTLLKQARAYGLGLVLATQNPVDLDYKGLSNTGTWFIGRLQTERDKARVMEGLEGASGGSFDKQAMERTIAGLGKRRFLLLTRDHIRTLMSKVRNRLASAARAVSKPKRKSLESAPALPPSVEQYFVPGHAEEIVYHPRLIAAGDVVFTSARYNVEDERSVLHTVEFESGPVEIDWDDSEPLDIPVDDLLDEGAEGASYADCPGAASNTKAYPRWGKDYKRWLRQNENITLYKSKRFRLTSTAEETEGEFRARLQDAASEMRDQAIAKIRKRYASKVTTLENRLLRAEQAIAREKQQSTKKKLDTAISFGTAILGAVLGRKKLSASTATKIGSAIKTAGGASKEAADVERAAQTVAKVKEEMTALNASLEKEIADLDTAFDAQAEALDEIVVRAKSTDIHVALTGLVWLPYTADEKGRLRPVWR